MDFKILFAFLVYWSLIFFFFSGILTDDILFNDYTTTGEFNSTYTAGEISTGGGSLFGLFDVIGMIFNTLGRFLGIILFGFTPVLSGGLQVLFTVWSTLVTMSFIGLILMWIRGN